MLKFKNNKLEILNNSELKKQEILERSGLQKAIINSWDDFRKEIGMPDLYLIGDEVCPHDSVQDSLDILAFDPNENLPVVFELKRSKSKFQLLQALSYASMISSWSKEDYLKVARENKVDEISDLEDALTGIENEKNVKIILIAEKFDPEVVISSDWLYSNFDVQISNYQLGVFVNNEEVYFNLIQKYPLPELSDAYEQRKSRRSPVKSSDSSWDDVKNEISYEWGAAFIDYFLKFGPGDVDRRRWKPLNNFSHLPFEKVIPFFCKDWLRFYFVGKPENAVEILKSHFGKNIDLGEWRDGYSIKIHTKDEADKLFSFLNNNGKKLKAS